MFFSMIEEERIWRYSLIFTKVATTSRFFLRKQSGQTRRMETGPVEVLSGHRVAILEGGKMPFILGRHDCICKGTAAMGDDSYALIDIACVNGIMDEALQDSPSEQQADWEQICLR